MGRRFGTHPDVPDVRDRVFQPEHRGRLPRRVDLRPACPPVYDQHSLNSCSAHAIASLLWLAECRERGRIVPSPSRLFIYYNERVRERVVHHNVPVSLRDGYRAVASRGACPEPLWPYRVRDYARKPSIHCYRTAADNRAIVYFRIHRDLRHLRSCLAQGHPFTLGASIHESFMTHAVKHTGRVPMPRPHERLLGGHAMLIVGYDDRTRTFLVRNSWGAAWGLGGYAELPYDYLLHPSLAWDFWTCQRVGARARLARQAVAPYRTTSTVMSSACGADPTNAASDVRTTWSASSAARPWALASALTSRSRPYSSPASLRASVTPSLKNTTRSPGASSSFPSS